MGVVYVQVYVWLETKFMYANKQKIFYVKHGLAFSHYLFLPLY